VNASAVPLNDVIRQSTVNSPKMIQHSELGHLSDIAVLHVMEGRFGYVDGSGTIAGNRRLLCEMTLKGGRIVWNWNARVGTDYRKMSSDYGIRDVDKIILPRNTIVSRGVRRDEPRHQISSRRHLVTPVRNERLWMYAPSDVRARNPDAVSTARARRHSSSGRFHRRWACQNVNLNSGISAYSI
jgi:hypothetical protein